MVGKKCSCGRCYAFGCTFVAPSPCNIKALCPLTWTIMEGAHKPSPFQFEVVTHHDKKDESMHMLKYLTPLTVCVLL